VDAIVAAGIQSFVDLTHRGEKPEYESLLPEGVYYRRAAISDHGVPDTEADMTGILVHIREQMAAGRPVYLHCHAGIGRTGTVAGCWLAETGFPGELALFELNRLWQQSVVSRAWRKVPETAGQRTYVQRWRVESATGK
jgi:protein-tyrosine phosphatase